MKLAQTIGVPVPDPLFACIEAGTGIVIEGRERSSLHKLVIGMAMKFYGYDPSVSRSPVPSRIANDLAGLGLGLTPKTIKKHLDQGSALLLANGNKKDLC